MKTRSQVGFCPFCRESFEDAEFCPDHELELVPFDKLPRPRKRKPRDDEVLPIHDPRFGRGLLALSAVLLLVAFALPFVTIHVGDELTVTGFEVASRRVRSLWVVPALAAGFISILVRRRTPHSMRGVRVAVPTLSVLGMTSLAYTLFGLHRGASEMGRRLGVEGSVELGVGLIGTGLALVLAFIAGVRLGVVPRSAKLSDGGSLADDDHIVV
jgi:hypothetical protein